MAKGNDILKGPAIIIDNEITSEANIKSIISKIRKHGIPTIEFASFEDAGKHLKNLLTVNFIILDWQMLPVTSTTAPIGVTAGATLQSDNNTKVIEFIKQIQQACFAPIFIFTSESQTDIDTQIIPALKNAGLYFDEPARNFIYVRNKREILRYNRLFKEVESWMMNTPSIYLLRMWDDSLAKAKNEIFWSLYKKSNGLWPKILWKHFESESEDPTSSFCELISQLVSTTMSLKPLDSRKILRKTKPVTQEISDIHRATMYIGGDLHGIKPGDIFKDGSNYYLNIRPECDTVQGRSGCDNMLYVLRGHILQQKELRKFRKDQYSKTMGIIQHVNEAILPLLDGQSIIRFSFRKIDVKPIAELSTKRLCRLTHPYIENIQQRFSTFLGRIGTPRLPKDIEKSLFI